MAAEAWNTSELLAACCGATVKAWAPAASEPRREVKITEGADVRALDWSGNNKVLAVAGDRSQITMVGGGKVIGYVPESPEPALAGVTALKFSADSKRLAIGCANRGLHIRDLRSQGAGNKSITDHRGAISALAISPDDALLASSSSAGQLLVHDFKSGARLGALPGGDGPLRHALAFCPVEADLLAAAGDDGGVGVWSVRARALRHDMRRLHRGGTTGVRFAPDSPSVLYTCGGDMRLLALDTRQPSGSQEALVMHAPQPLTCLDARFDARSLAVGTAAGGVLVFDLRAPGQPANAYSFGEAGPVRCVRWQNAPSSSSKHKAAATAAPASAATAPSLSFGGQLGRATPAAVGGGGGLTPREALTGTARGGAAASGLIGAGRAGVTAGVTSGARTPRSVTPEMGVRGAAATPELSHASELALDGMRAVSPVRMADSNVDGTPSAATAAPGPLTPGDSFTSGMAAFMVTPGVGLTRGLTGAGANGSGLADGATPVSRLAPFGSAGAAAAAGGAAAAGSASAATALPPVAAGGRGALANGTQRGESGAAAAGKAAAAGRVGTAGAAGASRPPTGSRPASSTGMAATGARAGSGSGAAAAAGTANGGAAAAGSAPSSRAGSVAASAAMDAAAAAAIESLPPSGSTTPRLGRGGDAAAAGTAVTPAAGAAAAGPGALREDVFKGYVDQQMAAMRQDVRNLHLEVLQQFHQAQMDLMSVAEGLAQRQEAILQRLDALGDQVQGLADARGVAPGISLAWL